MSDVDFNRLSTDIWPAGIGPQHRQVGNVLAGYALNDLEIRIPNLEHRIDIACRQAAALKAFASHPEQFAITDGQLMRLNDAG